MLIIHTEDSVILNNMKFLLVIGLLLIGFAIYTFLTSNAVSTKPQLPSIHPIKTNDHVVAPPTLTTHTPHR